MSIQDFLMVYTKMFTKNFMHHQENQKKFAHVINILSIITLRLRERNKGEYNNNFLT